MTPAPAPAPLLPQLLKSRGLRGAPKAHVFKSCSRWVGRRGVEWRGVG